MSLVYKASNQYRVYCTTERTYVLGWSNTLITTCPNNNTHTIDSTSITIIDSASTNNVKIIEEHQVTGGNYCTESKNLSIPINQTVISDFTWPFPVSVICVKFNSDSTHQGDTVTTVIKPNTTIGNITANVLVGDTIISVAASTIQYIQVGFHMTLTDGVNSSDLKRVVSIDKSKNTLTMESASTNAFSAASPTYTQMNIKNIYNYEIAQPQEYNIGTHSIGCSSIPANTTLRLIYTNKSTTQAKYFVYYFEYFY
jgi:hypothetical protein